MADDADLSLLNKEIDALLRKHRPDRYDVRHSDDETEPEEERLDAGWLDALAEEIADRIPEAVLRQRLALSMVRQREGVATKATNSLLRKINAEGQLVLGWWDLADDPVSVISRITRQDRPVRIHEERVALRAMTATDFLAFEQEERRRAASDFTARNGTGDGALWIAEQMTTSGARDFFTWACEELPPGADL